MADYQLSPLNDLVLEAQLKKFDLDENSETFGEKVSLTSGTVTAFLATSNGPTATAADASLVGTVTHAGNGRWYIEFDAAILTAALLATHFASTTPYCIISVLNGSRTAVELTYSATRAAVTP